MPSYGALGSLMLSHSQINQQLCEEKQREDPAIAELRSQLADARTEKRLAADRLAWLDVQGAKIARQAMYYRAPEFDARADRLLRRSRRAARSDPVLSAKLLSQSLQNRQQAAELRSHTDEYAAERREMLQTRDESATRIAKLCHAINKAASPATLQLEREFEESWSRLSDMATQDQQVGYLLDLAGVKLTNMTTQMRAAGDLHVYFDGSRKPDGSGHGHIIIMPRPEKGDLMLVYWRPAGQPHGPQHNRRQIIEPVRRDPSRIQTMLRPVTA